MFLKSATVVVLLYASLGFFSTVESARFTRTLEPTGKFNVTWEYSTSTGFISFGISVRTEGWVGLGISPTNSMLNGDIVIGGVDTDGSPYFADRHGIGQTTPPIDASQDYTLVVAEESAGVTRLYFTRLMDTGDAEDVKIEDKNVYFLYAWGEIDQIGYHRTNRGLYEVNIMNPE